MSTALWDRMACCRPQIEARARRKWHLQEQDAADAAQDAILRVIVAKGEDGEIPSAKYVDEVLDSVLKDRLRASARRHEDLTAQVEEPRSDIFTCREAQAVIGEIDLVRAVRRLPKRAREVVLLIDTQKLTYDECADKLRITRHQVAGILRRARARLRHELS